MNHSLYLERYSYRTRLIDAHPDPHLGIIVVIPCYFEPDLIETLQSLERCDTPNCSVEVIIILNESHQSDRQVSKQNEETLAKTKAWINSEAASLSFHIWYEKLPPKHAGVGLARKIGMDEAVRRFSAIDRDGVIVCLDADCTCSRNYLIAIEDHFNSRNTVGCSIYFEHPLSGPLEPEVYQAIEAYELHLRYYVHGLRFSGLPCAFQTVGSCMAVRSSVYVKQGGMNKRKAGEDFYFLQKIIKLGGFSELTSCTVYPSPRASSRVPFGTGRAIFNTLHSFESKSFTYHPKTFVDLKQLVKSVVQLYPVTDSSTNEVWETLPYSFQGFKQKDYFQKTMKDFYQKTSSQKSFEKRFYQWADGFFAFKFANYASENHYQKVEIDKAAYWMLSMAYGIKLKETDTKALLVSYRQLDRDDGNIRAIEQ